MHREHSSNPNAPLHSYTFGSLTLTFRGLGVPLLSDATKARIDAMDVQQAREANRAAWKQSKECLAIANRHNNFSQSGNISIYDNACHQYRVAELVKRATWFRIVRDNPA